MSEPRSLYSIRNWEKYFECAQSRKVTGALKWLPLPVRHDGESYRRLIAKPNGTALLGAWVLILQVAAKCPKRGVLANDSGPLDADSLAIRTGGNAALFQEAFAVLSSDEIGWLDVRTRTKTIPKNDNGSVLPLRYHCDTTAVDGSGLPQPQQTTAVDGRGSCDPQETTRVAYIQTDIHTNRTEEENDVDKTEEAQIAVDSNSQESEQSPISKEEIAEARINAKTRWFKKPQSEPTQDTNQMQAQFERHLSNG